MEIRPHSSSKAALTYEYDMDLINKKLSNLFGTIEHSLSPTGKPVSILKLKPGIIEALYKANLADEGSHKESNGSHSFKKTIDGYTFTYIIEPYGNRPKYDKPNGVMIIFPPCDTKSKTKSKRFIGYKEGETDSLFRRIVITVAKIPSNRIKERAMTLKSINNVRHGIKEPLKAANNVFSNPNIVHRISSMATKKNKKHYDTRSTFRKLKEKHNKHQENLENIIENIGENNENGNNENGNNNENNK
jgi:hypothetical protein